MPPSPFQLLLERWEMDQFLVYWPVTSIAPLVSPFVCFTLRQGFESPQPQSLKKWYKEADYHADY